MAIMPTAKATATTTVPPIATTTSSRPWDKNERETV